MKKLASLVAAVAIVPVLFASAPVSADSPGQLSNGETNYKVRNVTTNGDYAQSITAACGDTVKYSVILSNSDFGKLTDLTVKANLASGAISASANNVIGETTSVSGNAKVNTEGTLTYVAGSSVRIEQDATTRTDLSDGVVSANGVNVGDLNGSTLVYVQWEAKSICETPTVNDIKVCDLTTKKIVTIKENAFDSAKYSKDLSKCDTPSVQTELTKTGPSSMIALVAGVSALAAVAYNVVLRRQNER